MLRKYGVAKLRASRHWPGRYVDSWGVDEMGIDTGPEAEPLLGLALGFLLLHWLHPNHNEREWRK